MKLKTPLLLLLCVGLWIFIFSSRTYAKSPGKSPSCDTEQLPKRPWPFSLLPSPPPACPVEIPKDKNSEKHTEVTILQNTLYPLSPYLATVRIDCPTNEQSSCLNIYLGFLTQRMDTTIILRDKERSLKNGYNPTSFPPKDGIIKKFPIDKLSPGQVYSLTVKDLGGSSETISFAFSVLSKNEAEKLDDEIKNIEKLPEIQKISDPDQQDIAKKIVEAGYYKRARLISYTIDRLEKIKKEQKIEKYPEYHGMVLMALGDSYFEMGIFSKAKENYEEALRVLKNLQISQDKSEIEAEINSNLGAVYLYEDQSPDTKNTPTQKLKNSITSLTKAQDFYCKRSNESVDCKALTDKIDSLILLNQ
jgi:hypothetical protein